MAHAKMKSNKDLIKEGMEMYKSKSAMKKHEKAEPKKKEASEGKASKSFVKAMEKQYPKGAVVTPLKGKKK